MQSAVKKILVVGGNGFIGSAVCRAALGYGLNVTSISSSGKPYRTAKGHSPEWISKVDWQAADALRPETYAHLLPGVNGVVHTLGTLLEDARYKKAVRDGSLSGLVSAFISGGGGNPLKRGAKGSYEEVNRDSALRVCETFLSSPVAMATENGMELSSRRAFIYISAEDVFRPFIPARYIETKREAEERIANMISARRDFRGVYIRPSLVYHAHHRPLTSPAAALIDLSASVHKKVPTGIPTPSSILHALDKTLANSENSRTGSFFESMANCLNVPPIHVDHVAQAICLALLRDEVTGVIGVGRMRELIGWTESRDQCADSVHT